MLGLHLPARAAALDEARLKTVALSAEADEHVVA
jgi:hypothetical protein